MSDDGRNQAFYEDELAEAQTHLATLQARGDRLAEALSIAMVVLTNEGVCDPHCTSCVEAYASLTEWRKPC